MNSSNEIFAAALGIVSPWYVRDVTFDAGDASASPLFSGTRGAFGAGKRLLVIGIDFVKGSKFSYHGIEGLHPVHDTVLKRYRHLNFFQHECYLEVRTPRLDLADSRVLLAEPEWAGKLSGFTLLFEALILAMCRQMPFAAVARLVGETWHLPDHAHRHLPRRRQPQILKHQPSRRVTHSGFKRAPKSWLLINARDGPDRLSHRPFSHQ
jgi:transposase